MVECPENKFKCSTKFFKSKVAFLLEIVAWCDVHEVKSQTNNTSFKMTLFHLIKYHDEVCRKNRIRLEGLFFMTYLVFA